MRTKLVAVMAVAAFSLFSLSSLSAQNAVLAQLYGKGVHAYNSGDYTTARQLLSMAINNGSNDPRAYYFRGMVAHSQGNTYEAESDWQQGARLEAQGRTNPFVGRSLTRFQGTGRLKLEGIRQEARLQAMSARAARSNQRLGELEASGIRSTVINPQPTPPPPSVVPDTVAPPAAADPFAGDLAEGEPNVTSDDALEGAMDDPFADEPAAAPDAGGDAPADAGDADPFGGDAAPADADPFGGDSAPADDDPFGGADDDPFAE